MKFEDTISDEYKGEFLSCCKNDLDQVLKHFNPGKSPYKLPKKLGTYIAKLEKYDLITPQRKESFETKFKDDLNPSNIDHLKLNRICTDYQNYDIEDCFLAILAWGQLHMGKNTLFLAWKSLNNLDFKKFLEDIRSGKEKDRKKIYSRFITERLEGRLKGINVAYFTKLIYFLMIEEQGRGYILDQFTARSANILLKKNIINIDKNINKENGEIRLLVDGKRNDAEAYEKYCSFIEDNAKYLDNYFRKELSKTDKEIEPKHSEIFIFYDNKDPSGWRKKSEKIFKQNICSLVEVE